LVVYSRGTSAAGKHLFPFNASHLEN
jgi:hypothetical protein